MKFFLTVDKTKEPSVTVVCPRVTEEVRKIEEICKTYEDGEDILYGYIDDEVTLLNLQEIECFFTNDGKVFASVASKEYLTKLRIKNVLEIVDDSFIKINQGCVVNIKYIQSFGVSIGGSLKILLKNGYCDYVSRRELVNIKRRFDL